MDEYTFEDALVGATVTCSYPGLQAKRVNHDEANPSCTSLFFPGCSLINYALPLVTAVNDLLVGAGRVDGMSLLCCGKILQWEPNADEVRPAFEQQFRDHIAESNIKRIVAACPNCVLALRTLLAVEERTAGIEVVPLVSELVDMGYRVDPSVAMNVACQDPRIADAYRQAIENDAAETAGEAAASDETQVESLEDANAKVVFCVKDSCPDRETGEFADGLRAIMPPDMIAEPAHNRRKSICCGSRPRAAGRMDAAVKSCAMNHDEAKAAGAQAIVTSCMSCTFLLSVLTPELPVFHYLELLYDYRIPWEYTDQYMKLRFLFDSALGTREFYGLDE